jgi:hypothetical protein
LPAARINEPIVFTEPTAVDEPVNEEIPETDSGQQYQTPDRNGEPGARPSRLVPARFQATRNGQAEQIFTAPVEQTTPERAPVERKSTPRRQTEAPLIEPDEELPAWNAPPRAIPEPEPYVPQAPRETPRPEPTSGFESSLFADLDAPTGDEAEVAGPFQSRLLNELTRSEDETVEGAADVLLDEFSLPSRNQPSPRDADNGR